MDQISLEQLFAQPFTYSFESEKVLLAHLQQQPSLSIAYIVDHFQIIQFLPLDKMFSRRHLIQTMLTAAQTSEDIRKAFLLEPESITLLPQTEKSKLTTVVVADFVLIMEALLPLLESPASTVRLTDCLFMISTAEKFDSFLQMVMQQNEAIKSNIVSKLAQWLSYNPVPEFQQVIKKWAVQLLHYTELLDTLSILAFVPHLTAQTMLEVLESRPPQWQQSRLPKQLLQSFVALIDQETASKTVNALLQATQVDDYTLVELLEHLHGRGLLTNDVFAVLLTHPEAIIPTLNFCKQHTLPISQDILKNISSEVLTNIVRKNTHTAMSIFQYLAQVDPNYLEKLYAIVQIPELQADSYYFKELLTLSPPPVLYNEAERFIKFFISQPTVAIPLEWAVIFRDIKDINLIQQFLNSRVFTHVSEGEIKFFEIVIQNNSLFARQLWPVLKRWNAEGKVIASDNNHLRQQIFKAVPFPHKLFLW